MSKKKWKQDVEGLQRRLLILLQLNEERSFSQPDIKQDFFKVFRDAYKGGYCCPLRYYCYLDSGGRSEWIWPKGKPMICGDAIWEYASKQHWVHPEMSGGENRYDDIHRMMSWWDAWTFAWEQLGYRMRCYRNIEHDPPVS